MEKEIKRLLRCFKRTELSEQDVADALKKLFENEKVVLPQANVSGRSELLFAFVKYLQSENAVDSAVSSYIDDFLSKQ